MSEFNPQHLNGKTIENAEYKGNILVFGFKDKSVLRLKPTYNFNGDVDATKPRHVPPKIEVLMSHGPTEPIMEAEMS